MAFTREDRGAAPAPPETAAARYPDARSGSPAPAAREASFASWYQSLFGSPVQPSASSADDRRTSTAASPALPQNEPMSEAAWYAARWGTPMPVSSAEERRQPQLAETLKGMTTSADAAERRGRGRQSADDRRTPTVRRRQTADERRQRAAPPQTADERRRPAPIPQTADDRRQPVGQRRQPSRSFADERRQPGQIGPPPDREAAQARQTIVFTPNEQIPAPPTRGPRKGKGDVKGRTRVVRTGTYDPNAVADARAALADALAAVDAGPSFAKGSIGGGYTPDDIVPGDLMGDWISGSEWGRGEGKDTYSVNLPIDIDWHGIGGGASVGFGFHGDEPRTTRQRDPEQAAIQDAQVALDQALRAERAHAIGADVQPAGGGQFGPIHKQVNRLTPEEYEALTPTARAAVDFNGSLARTARRDRHNQDLYNPSPEERAKYDKDVAAMFGEDRDSTLYAPETVALLKQIGYSDPNADLDDFLGLKAGIREEDIRGLEQQENSAQPANQFFGNASPDRGPLRENRMALANQLQAEQASHAADVIAQGEQMLQTFGATAAVARNPMVASYGGVESAPRPTLGFGTPQFETLEDGRQVPANLDTYFQTRFAAIRDAKQQQPTTILADMAKDLSPEEMRSFWDYARQQIQTAKTYGAELPTSADMTSRSIEELDQVFGGGARGGTAQQVR